MKNITVIRNNNRSVMQTYIKNGAEYFINPIINSNFLNWENYINPVFLNFNNDYKIINKFYELPGFRPMRKLAWNKIIKKV
jgi:hypothetical protein